MGDLWALARNAAWAMARVRRKHGRLLAGQVVVTLVHAFIPAGIAVTIQGLVDCVTEASAHPEHATGRILVWIGIASAVALAEVIATAANRYLEQRWLDDLNLDVTQEVLEHAAGLELQYFEDPAFQDTMSRLQGGVARRFAWFIFRTFGLVANLLQMLTLITLLTVIEPTVLLVLVIVALPYLALQWRLVRSRYTEEVRRTRGSR